MGTPQKMDFFQRDNLWKNLTIPNLITILRIFLLPFFVYFLFSEDYSNTFAFFILIVCGLSDALDGFIARRFQMTSALGKVLDPLADKLAVLTIFIAFMIKGFLPLWMSLIVIIREVLVFLFSIFFFFTKTKLPEPVMTGKYAITFLYVAVLFSIFHQELAILVLLIALVFSLISGWSYALMAIQIIREGNKTSSY